MELSQKGQPLRKLMRVKGYSPVQGGDNFGGCGWVNPWLKNQTKLTVSFEFHIIMKFLNVYFFVCQNFG